MRRHIRWLRSDAISIGLTRVEGQVVAVPRLAHALDFAHREIVLGAVEFALVGRIMEIGF